MAKMPTQAELAKMTDEQLDQLAAALDAEADQHTAHADELRRFGESRTPPAPAGSR